MILMHKNAMDAAFVVVNRRWYLPSRETVFNGYWVTLGYVGKPTRLQYHLSNIVIENISDWCMLTETQVHTPRIKPGIPV